MPPRKRKPEPSVNHSHGDRPVPLSIARLHERFDRVEAMFALGKRIGQVMVALREEGLGSRQARRTIVFVKERWKREHDGQNREQRRAELRLVMSNTLQACFTRERGITVFQGGDRPAEVQYVRDPDLRTATEMIRLIAEFDDLGVKSAGPAPLLVSSDIIGALQKFYGLEPTVIDATPKRQLPDKTG